MASDITAKPPGQNATAVLLLVAFAAVAAYLSVDLHTDRQATIERAQELALTQVQLIAERLDNTLVQTNYLLEITALEVDRVATVPDFASVSSAEAMNRILRSWFLFADHVGNAAIYGADGVRLALLRRAEPTPPAVLRPGTGGGRGNAAESLHASESGLRMYHPLTDGGHVVACMEASHFRRDFQMILGDTASVFLLDAEGRVITSWGEDFLAPEEILAQSGESFGTLRTFLIDGHVVGISNLSGYPLRVAMAVNRDLVLRQWRSRAQAESMLVLAAFAVLAVSAVVIHRRNQQVWAMRARTATVDERIRVITALRNIELSTMRHPEIESALEQSERHLSELYPIRRTWIERNGGGDEPCPVPIAAIGDAARACSLDSQDGRVVLPVETDEDTRLRFVVDSTEPLPDDAVEVIQTALNSVIRIVRLHATEEERVRDAEQRARERENLVRETNHRVKNNLNVIQSLLSLEAARTTDEASQNLIAALKGRIASISLIHTTLYQTDTMTDLPFDRYCTMLVEQVREAYDIGESPAVIDVSIEPLSFPVDVVKRLGLILHELIGNALKYAHPPGKEERGTDVGSGKDPLHLSVRCRQVHGSGTVELLVSDNGPGLPGGELPEREGSIGYVLIHALAEELEGTLECWNDNGAHIRVLFPLPQ